LALSVCFGVALYPPVSLLFFLTSSILFIPQNTHTHTHTRAHNGTKKITKMEKSHTFTLPPAFHLIILFSDHFILGFFLSMNGRPVE